jgi:hypothetical protein
MANDEPDTLPAPTLDQLIVTAIKLVDAITEYRRPNETRVSTIPKREPEARRGGFGLMSAATLLNTDQEILRQRDIVTNPIVWSLKKTLHEVGQLIYDRVGSVNELLKIAEQIADRDPAHYSRRMSPLDSAWNGVGSGNDRWMS